MNRKLGCLKDNRAFSDVAPVVFREALTVFTLCVSDRLPPHTGPVVYALGNTHIEATLRYTFSALVIPEYAKSADMCQMFSLILQGYMAQQNTSSTTVIHHLSLPSVSVHLLVANTC